MAVYRRVIVDCVAALSVLKKSNTSNPRSI